jgi:catechol 2,3-dioxygenase-like lactoylglutathione lyase family enzyme
MKDAVIPVLPTRDHDKTVAFYTRLGFHEIARAGDYLMLKRDAFEVHFADHGDFFDVSQNPCGLYLRLEAVDALAAKAADLLLGGKGPEDKPWGMYEFAMSDPDETLVRVGWPSRFMRDQA